MLGKDRPGWYMQLSNYYDIEIDNFIILDIYVGFKLPCFAWNEI